MSERLDPDCTLSHEQRSAMVWQYHQQQRRAQQVGDPERADTSSRHVGGHGGPAERGAGARAETGEEDGRDAQGHLAEAVRRLHDTQRAGQRDRAVEQARYDATQREQARQARQQAHDEHEAQRAGRDDRDRAAADRASPGRAGADRASTHSGADGRGRAPSREHGRDQAGRDQAGRGLGNGLDEGYARRNRAADDHAERQQDRQRSYDD